MDNDGPTLDDGEIKVTAAMAEAGARVIITYHPQSLDWLTRDIATEVYRAMRAAELLATGWGTG